MLKKMLLIIAGLGLLLPVCAQTPKMKSEYVFAKVYRAEKDPAKYKDPAKAKELLAKRAAVVAELGALKKRLVAENKELGKLQAEFEACLQKLGLILNNNSSVLAVERKIAALEKEAKELPLTLANREKQLVTAQEDVKSSDAAIASAGFKKVEFLKKEIMDLKKKIGEIPAKHVELQKELRNTKRKVLRLDPPAEMARMSEISAAMTLHIESTEEAKKINRDLKALDAELDKLLKK